VTSHYIAPLMALAEEAGAANEDALDTVSTRFADTLAGDGLVHLFGSGHSVLPCQEAFPRYGSYVGFNPLTDPRLMWHDVLGTGGVRELLWLERTEGYIDKFLAHQPLLEGDVLVVYSHSGRNAAGIDAALYAKERGLYVVAVSSAHMLDRESPHSSGKRLADVADILLDTRSPVEDAIVDVDGWSRPVSGSSTVLAMLLTHELIARTAAKLAAQGIELPTFASPTVPGVTLDDTDRVYGEYRERMVDAARRQLPSFKTEMAR
jgi:uncharacterized phosphosugar-binding protein